MYCITDEQIDYILNDIRRNGVDMEDLQLNLLDHICCIIEQNLEDNGDFEGFYQKTVRQFYKKELREIEEETIRLLTFKNYYAMKKSMIVSGTFSAIIFILGSVFKIMHWPGAGVLLVLGILVFSFLFLPLAFYLKTRESENSRDKWVLGIATVVGILYCLSTLFLIQHWPGARIMWLSTLSISFFILIPLYFFSGIRKPETKVNTIVSTILLMGFLGLQFTLTALRPSPEVKGRVYTYIQTEQLLKNRQQGTLSGNTEIKKILNTCETIKAKLLHDEFGLSSIPPDYDNKGINVREQHIGHFFNSSESGNLLANLRDEVTTYNRSAINKIPVEYSILEPGFLDKPFCTNLFVLINITQLQLFLANNVPQEAEPLSAKN